MMTPERLQEIKQELDFSKPLAGNKMVAELIAEVERLTAQNQKLRDELDAVGAMAQSISAKVRNFQIFFID